MRIEFLTKITRNELTSFATTSWLLSTVPRNPARGICLDHLLRKGILVELKRTLASLVCIIGWSEGLVLESFALKIRRRETPVFKFFYDLAKTLITANLPLPRAFLPFLRVAYSLHQGSMNVLRWVATFAYRSPLFRGRCESVGKRLSLARLPFIVGHAKIYIGDDVNFFGQVDIHSGRIFDEPKLIIHNRVDIGHGVSFIVNKEIVIEDDVNVAGGVAFMDTDSHPRDVDDRIADLPPKPEEIRPVRICKNAWISRGSMIMKGVTVGEGAIIGANSVVVTDIPPHSIAMGNPARVIVKNAKPDKDVASISS
jgi:acetyltransferase-like isoleucine patch superfamily enzyme